MHKVMRVVLWTLVAGLLAGPLAMAGSADDPEIADARGDHAGGVSQDPFSGYDVVYAFFADDDGDCGGDHMRVQLGLANILADGAQSPGAAFSASVYFSVNGNEYRTYIRPAGNTEDPASAWIYMYDITNAPGTRIVVPGGVDNAAGAEFYYWCVPHEVLVGGRGDVVTDAWARTYLDNYGPTDLAPDGAPGEVGREYVIGGVVEEAIEPLNVTVASATAVISNGTASFTITVANNGTADQTIAWSVQNITAGFNATVTPANATVAAGQNVTFDVTVHLANGTVPAHNGTAAYNGTVQLAYNGTAGNGTVELTVMGMVRMSYVDTGNAAELNDGGNKGSPGAAPVVVVAALAIALRRR